MADFYVIHSYNYDVPPDLLSSAGGGIKFIEPMIL